MKKNQKLIEISKQLHENSEGKKEGGFELILSSVNNALIVGGSQEANNCYGGNCAIGCGLNTAQGCGGAVNKVAGCGAK